MRKHGSKKLYAAPLLAAGLLMGLLFPAGERLEDFGDAKKVLQNKIWYDHRQTIYCGAAYDADKNIELPAGFHASSHQSRSGRMEWEHAVPAENFGRTFRQWRDGDPACQKHGKPFRGRKCAEKTSPEYRQMEADMYNLFPSIGSVNAARGNREYADLSGASADLGNCGARVRGKFFEPPERARGQLARASLYMAWQYPRFRLSGRQEKLFRAWDRQYPVDKWECERAKRIEKFQGNENIFIKKPCTAAGLW